MMDLEKEIDLIRRQLRSDPQRMRRVCLALRNQGMSYPKIGAMLNRDHKTIMYHLREPHND